MLTIGLAHYRDFSGLWATIQSIRLNNKALSGQMRFLVIDNSPEDEETAKAVQGLIQKIGPIATYHALEAKGTSISRNEIFNKAETEYVLVLDCHVELDPLTLPILLSHYTKNPKTKDIISGPLIDDSLQSYSTHFKDAWGGGMWGRWSQAWRCSCDGGIHFDLVDEANKTKAVRLTFGNIPVNDCPVCQKAIPSGIPWAGHVAEYEQLGFLRAGIDPSDSPFDIPGQGLGMFSCRRDAWLGFNKDARAFGAEELCIHEKYRQAGHRAICLPGAFWNHRFYREKVAPLPDGQTTYPNTHYDKARNYVLWFNELNLDLGPIKSHFVDTPIEEYLPEDRRYVTEAAWNALIRDPVHVVDDQTAKLLVQDQVNRILPHLVTFDDLYQEVQGTVRDLDQHMPRLMALAAGQKHVVELTARKESTIALLAGRPKQLTSYSTESDQYCWKAAAFLSNETYYQPKHFDITRPISDIPENDLLFIDTVHTYAFLARELATYAPKCRRLIVIHDTDLFGYRGEDRQAPGLRRAIGEFAHANPKWRIVSHSNVQYGLTVLSQDPQDHPQEPIRGFAIAGPGTELKRLLEGIGVKTDANCICNERAEQMDTWGVQGCRDPKNHQTIVGWLREGVWTRFDGLWAIKKMALLGLATQLNVLKPFESLVDLAIDKAAQSDQSVEHRKDL